MASPKKVVLPLLIILVPILAYVAYEIFPSASNQGYAPTQPIAFSHKLHAGAQKDGGMGIECLYCHTNAERSIHATVPSVSTCMNCHRVVMGNNDKGKAELAKLRAAFEANKPVEWIRIHELPDHAHFNHKRHVKAGVACQTCHGPVQEMEKVYQHAPLNMGWCLDCHRGLTTPKNVLDTFYPEDQDNRGKPVAPINCATCHY